MATSGTVIALGVLCGVFAILLLLLALFICRRILRRKKLKLKDDMEMNRLLVDEIMSNGDFTGESIVAETIVLPAQQDTVERGNCSPIRDDVLSLGSLQELPVSPTPTTACQKVSIKKKLYTMRRQSSSSGGGGTSPSAPSVKPPTSIGQPLNGRSRSGTNLVFSSKPNSPKLIHFGSHLSLDGESDSSEVFSDSISAPPSPTARSEADETGDDIQGTSSKGSKAPVNLEYSIYYSSAESTLVISVKGATGIPSKYGPTCTSFVRVYLSSPKTCGGYLQTCTVRRSLEPMYNDQLQFSKLTLEEVWVNSLRFKLYVKGQWGGHHETLAEASRHCASLIREADEVYEISEVLKRKRSKWRSRPRSRTTPVLTKEHLPGDLLPPPNPQSPQGLGDLFVSIQYQLTASRFKVVVRKADHLSKGVTILGTQSSLAHYIGVNLIRNEQAVVQSETTSSLAGSQPTWNQPLLLHLNPSRALTDYCIEFLLMRVRFHSSSRAPIGRLVVGPKVEGTGGMHWDEVLLPRLTEVTRWHPFQPNHAAHHIHHDSAFNIP